MYYNNTYIDYSLSRAHQSFYKNYLFIYFRLTYCTGFMFIGTLLDIGVWYHVKDLKIYDDGDGDVEKSQPVDANSNTDIIAEKSIGVELKKRINT